MKQVLIFMAGCIVGFIVAVGALAPTGGSPTNSSPAKVALSGLYRDDAGDSFEFRSDGRLIVNGSAICTYSIDGSEITKDCGRGAPELLKMTSQGDIVSTMAMGDKVIYKKAP